MDLGPAEVVIIVIVVVLLFGAKKLPELARGTGQALRIFKEETRPSRRQVASDGGGPSREAAIPGTEEPGDRHPSAD